MALYNFRKIDITTQEGKRKIIDTFINSIYLYDDHLKIIYNANSKEETVSLAELESSTLFSRGAPWKAPCANIRHRGLVFSNAASAMNAVRSSALPRRHHAPEQGIRHLKSPA